MGYKNREIEVKLLLDGENVQYERIVTAVRALLKDRTSRTVSGHSYDIYWKSRGNADFVRLRRRPRGRCQMTVKSTDGKSNLDRLEVDVEALDYDNAEILLTELLGNAEGHVYKRYTVFFLGDDHTNVSVYQIDGSDKVFIEIEALTFADIITLTDQIIGRVRGPFKYQRVFSSLYNMFVQGVKPETQTITRKNLAKVCRA